MSFKERMLLVLSQDYHKMDRFFMPHRSRNLRGFIYEPNEPPVYRMSNILTLQLLYNHMNVVVCIQYNMHPVHHTGLPEVSG